jgi:acyl-CoA synthetase (NDP forming)
MKELFCPSSVVVIGVSTKPFNLGKVIAWNLTEFGFDGVVHLLGTEPGVILGRTIQTSLDDIPDPIDLAIILTPAKTVPGLMEECGRKGIRRVIIESGGFGEFSEEGRKRSDELKRIAAKYNMRFIGPNCIGIINGANGLCTPFTPMKNVLARGGVGILAQSGGVALSLLFMCDSEHLGYSKFATIGNKLDIDENDVLEYFIEDPDTKVICLYLESIKDGRRLTSLARRSSKPIVVHKANIGSLSRKIAQSHTEALANDDQVVDAALQQAGMVRFRDMLSYMDFVKILQLPRMKGRNLAIVSRSGGHAVIAADAAYTYGFNLSPFRQDFLDEIRKHLRADVIRLSNPLDLGDLFDYDVYARIISHTIQQENVDGILFMHTYNSMIEGEASLKLLGTVADLSEKYDKPVAVCVSTEHFEISRLHKELELPIFVSPERAILALDRSIKYEERRAAVPQIEETVQPDPLPDDRAIQQVIDRCAGEGRLPLLPEALDMIRALGLAVPEHRVVSDVEALEEVAADLPGPYAAKVIAEGVSHKSDSGGVVLSLADLNAVREACKEMAEEFRDSPEAGMKGVLVQQMAPRARGRYELIIGGKRDPQFGPVVLVGYGGILVEVFASTSIRMAPLSPREIDEMIKELPASEMLNGIRGLPPIDRDALKDAVLRVAYLMVTFPEIDQIDVNPLIVSSSGALAVDARVFLNRAQE